MRATFILTRSDLRALQRVIGQRLTAISGANRKLFFANIALWIPIGMAGAAYAALYRKYPFLTRDLTIVAGLFGIGVALLVVSFWFKNHLCRKAMLGPGSWFLAEQTVDLSDDGVSAAGGFGTATYRWSAFRFVAEDTKNLYLFIDNAQAYVLPKAALGTEQEVDQVKAWLNAAAVPTATHRN